MSYKSWSRENEGKEPIPEEERDPWDDSKSLNAEIIILPDGRKLKCELWSESEYVFLTYTFLPIGLENYTKEQLVDYLDSQGINIDLNKFPLEDISLLDSKNRYQLTITISEG